MLRLQGVSYVHSDGNILFSDIHLTLNKQDKIALIGNNGAGKSTLLKIIAGILVPSEGQVKSDVAAYYVPQHFGQFNRISIAQALQVADKLEALQQILGGDVSESNLALLNDDWSIGERCAEALMHWGLDGLDLSQKMETLSGGQKTRIFLAGIMIHDPRLVLLDEPSNHLDAEGRKMLYSYISSTKDTLVAVSHDRTLLDLPDAVFELAKPGITVYGGNYSFYLEQKSIEAAALSQDLKSTEKELRKAKETERASLERQQKLDARGKKKQEKAGLPTIAMNTLRNNAEKSTSKLKDVHAGKIDTLAQELDRLRKEVPDRDKMKMGFDDSSIHAGKILITATDINFGYDDKMLWEQPLNFNILSGERIVINGLNGSGKTTLIRMMLGDLQPWSGTLYRADIKAVYIDQDYSLIDDKLSVYQQAEACNSGSLQEHEIKTRLDRFLFTKNDWNKLCSGLSGGEKMRLMLCCLTIAATTPDIIVLDEPTNNLDTQNTDILTAAISQYKGTLIVVSHDAWFLKQVNAKRAIDLGLTMDPIN